MRSVKSVLGATPTLFVLVAIVATGCNHAPKTDSTTPSTTGISNGVKPAKPALTKLEIKDTTPGKGSPVTKGDLIFMLYKGTFADGTVFDTNIKEGGVPFSLTLGGGTVIKGWDRGLVGMKVGGKRTLGIPWELAYGKEGRGTIPGQTDLYFDVELLATIKKGEEDVVERADVKVGSGRAVKEGDSITVKYKGTLITGKEFDSQASFTFRVQATPPEVIPGFDSGVLGMKVGGKRKLTIPPLVGYGMRVMGDIPSNSILNFEIELVKIK